MRPTPRTARAFLQSALPAWPPSRRNTGDRPSRRVSEKPSDRNRHTSSSCAGQTCRIAFPSERALTGLKDAGSRRLGTIHRGRGRDEGGPARQTQRRKARELGKRCRDLGLGAGHDVLEHLPEAKNALEVLRSRSSRRRLLAWAGADVRHTARRQSQVGSSASRKLAPLARDHNVMIVVKQHGGETGTGPSRRDHLRGRPSQHQGQLRAGNVMDLPGVCRRTR